MALCYYGVMVRTTIYIPDELHEKLRGRAFKEKTSISKIIVETLEPPTKPQVTGFQSFPKSMYRRDV